MKSTPRSKTKPRRSDDLRPEYHFDYTKAKPNRFAVRIQPGALVITLDPDVAEVFNSADSVNAVLRALLKTMPRQRTPRG